MKRTILTLMAIILLTGGNLYAAGDLVVNGNIGVGTSTPTVPLHIVKTDSASMMTLEGTITQTGQTGLMKGVNLIFSGTSTRPNIWGAYYSANAMGTGLTDGTIYGFSGNAMYNAEGTLAELIGATNILNINTNKAGSVYSVSKAYGNSVELRKGASNQKDVTITNYYGFYSFGNAGPGVGSISATNARHAYFENFPNFSGTFTNVSGLWIDKQTRGTNNYGIVLNGDGTGSDIVFGTTQAVKLYSNAGDLYVKDAANNVTLLGPHDPETGEWIFYSKNIKTGRVVRVEMEKLVKAVEKLTGEKFMVETLLEGN